MVASIWVNDTHPFLSRHTPNNRLVDAYARNLDYSAFGKQGHLIQQSHANYIEHRNTHDQYQATAFSTRWLTDSGATWHAKSNRASAENHFKTIALRGKVVLLREAQKEQEPIRLTTEKLKIYPKISTAFSPVYTEILEPNLKLTGTKVSVNYQSEKIHILENLIAHYLISHIPHQKHKSNITL